MRGLATASADLVAAAQEAYLSAIEEIGDGGGSFAGIATATGDGENEVAEGKLGPLDFAQMFFHMGQFRLADILALAIRAFSNTNFYEAVSGHFMSWTNTSLMLRP